MSVMLSRENFKEETINGNIYLMSPAIFKHTKIIKNIYDAFSSYLKGKECQVYQDNLYVIFDDENKFIPDISVVCDKSKFSNKGYEGVPILVVEVISPSSVKRDRELKKEAYEKFGVKEYWIIDINNKSVEQYVLGKSKYSLNNVYTLLDNEEIEDLEKDQKEIYTKIFRVDVFKDLEMDLENIFG